MSHQALEPSISRLVDQAARVVADLFTAYEREFTKAFAQTDALRQKAVTAVGAAGKAVPSEQLEAAKQRFQLELAKLLKAHPAATPPSGAVFAAATGSVSVGGGTLGGLGVTYTNGPNSFEGDILGDLSHGPTGGGVVVTHHC